MCIRDRVMQIAREVAGFSMAQADNMRKAMGKKIKEKMQRFKEDFIRGAMKNDVPKKSADEIFKLILDFADYGFNKSHGVAYSVLAYYTAYLKTHYPLEFLAVSMEGRKDDETELQFLADEAKRMKIKVRQPDVNESNVVFKTMYGVNPADKGEIIYGLSAIKGVGEKASGNLINERTANGVFKSLVDFLIRVDLRLVNKKTIEGLIFAGAFDCIDKNRRKLYLNLERSTMFAQRMKDTPELKGQHGLFSDTPSVNGIRELKMEEFEEFTEVEKYKLEKESIGFYLSGHPLEKYRREIEHFVNLSFADDVSEIDFKSLGTVKMSGVISDLQIKISKRQNKFVVFNLIDFYGSGECVAFTQLYEAKQFLFKENKLVFVEGKAEENGDKIKLIVENIYPIDNFHQSLANNITINIFENKTDVNMLNCIKQLAESNPGSCSLFFLVINNGLSRMYKSNEYKINPSPDLISNLKKLVGDDNLRIN